MAIASICRRDRRKEAIAPSASMTPAAMATAPPDRTTKGSSTMPMQDTGRAQQYLMHKTSVFMKFIFFMPGNIVPYHAVHFFYHFITILFYGASPHTLTTFHI